MDFWRKWHCGLSQYNIAMKQAGVGWAALYVAQCISQKLTGILGYIEK